MARTDADSSNPWPLPPEASPRAATLARRIVSRGESFFRLQTAGGFVLIAATLAALALANGPYEASYHHALETPVGLRVGSWGFERSLHFWIDDALMTLFFFAVGLEIRREVHGGELRSVQKALLPAFAALGGMVAPALIYVAFTSGHAEAARGWGVPMATDIAFAVGVLALLGRRVPRALRVLLLAVAIIDDIGSILVIAIFYSASVDVHGLALAVLGVGGIVLMQRLGLRRPVHYLPAGLVVWVGMLRWGSTPPLPGSSWAS